VENLAFKVRIWLWSTNIKSLESVVNQIREIAQKTGVPIKGPIPLPTKRLEVPLLRLPHGEGSKHWEHWEMRIHKRLIDIEADERVLRRLMRIQVPHDVYIEIKSGR
jgi:small subunit ribosomal protein S10